MKAGNLLIRLPIKHVVTSTWVAQPFHPVLSSRAGKDINKVVALEHKEELLKNCSFTVIPGPVSVRCIDCNETIQEGGALIHVEANGEKSILADDSITECPRCGSEKIIASLALLETVGDALEKVRSLEKSMANNEPCRIVLLRFEKKRTLH